MANANITLAVGSQTPWGRCDSCREIAPGIYSVSTPSHGGYFIADEQICLVSQAWREFAAKWSHGWGDRWFEEDCAVYGVIATFPDLFPDDAVMAANAMASRLL